MLKANIKMPSPCEWLVTDFKKAEAVLAEKATVETDEKTRFRVRVLRKEVKSGRQRILSPNPHKIGSAWKDGFLKVSLSLWMDLDLSS